MGLAGEFQKIVALAEELEGERVPPRIAQRLCNAYERSTEKALVLAWYEITDVTRANRTVIRHAERGAREYLP